MTETVFCRKCTRSTEHELSRCITSSGGELFGWYCWNCNSRNDRRFRAWERKAFIQKNGIDPRTIPIAEIKEQMICSRCNNIGAELHHWAPQSMFPNDANLWPTDYLCKPCHDLWHKTVTPQLIHH